MVAKKPKYETFGEELNYEVAYLQAASALDVAAFYAVESRETERLESIAALWMAMAVRLEGGDSEQPEREEEDEEVCEKHPLGFAAAPVVIEPEEEPEVELENENGESD